VEEVEQGGRAAHAMNGGDRRPLRKTRRGAGPVDAGAGLELEAEVEAKDVRVAVGG